MWAPEYTVGAPDQRRLNYFVPSARQGWAEQVESGRTYQSPGRGLCVHAVEFSKTGAPLELRGLLIARRFRAAGEELSSPSASYLPPETCSGGRCSLAHPRWESMSLAAPERNSLPDGAEE